LLGVRWAALGGAAFVVRGPYDQAIPIVRTFIRKLDPGPFTEQLLDDLQVMLATRAIVGRLELPEAIPVLFFDEPRVEDQHAAVVAALNAVDRAAGRQPGEWEAHLGVMA
jgi:hypothetical protein